MPVFDFYSKRKKRATQQANADVYQYDELPQTLRVQIAHIFNDAFGDIQHYGDINIHNRWKTVHDIMIREKGLFELVKHSDNYQIACINWFLQAETDDALDMIEVMFRAISVYQKDILPELLHHHGMRISNDDAIEELNIRFRENGVGYQFEAGEVIRIDSQFIHKEIVKPALSLLSEVPFKKANEEYLLAHQHYREGKNKDAIVAAQRAFESTLKAICTKMRWTYQPGDRASDLIKIARKNGLFPEYLDVGFDTYIAMLKTGLPEVRNNAGGHGEAPTAKAVQNYIASYALHMTATNIVFLVEAAKAKK